MTNEIILRNVEEADLQIFYEHQLDPQATAMAEFPSREREAFMAHWKKNLANEDNITLTILYDGQVAGNIVSYVMDGEREVGYWLGREFWGKGIATQALAAFLKIVKMRPLLAHVVKHNIASQRVLQKCGFIQVGENAEELVLKLE